MLSKNHRWILSVGLGLVLALGLYIVVYGRNGSLTVMPLAAQKDATGGGALAAAPASAAGVLEANDRAAQQQAAGIPAGAVMFFDLTECPPGWSELEDAQGRYLVGLQDNVSLGATVGTSLADRENRPVGQHSHDINDGGHAHDVVDPGHSHTVNDPKHSHTIDDPGHSHQINNVYVNEPDHKHITDACVVGSSCEQYKAKSVTAPSKTTGITIDPVETGITVGTNTTSVSIEKSTTGITVNASGNVTGTNAPYVQFLVCRKD
jgi:hypothetical protein